MVFVHGGGHVQGSTSQVTNGVTLYDGTTLAAKGDVVVVTVQYRLGALGWLADDALGTSKKPAGNYGLLDQMAALRWVQHEHRQVRRRSEASVGVRRVGGRGRHVLAHRQSARSRAVFACADRERRLRRRRRDHGRAQAAVNFQNAAGCTNGPKIAECLRALPVDTVLHTLPSSVNLTTIGRPLYGPYVDGRVLPGVPARPDPRRQGQPCSRRRRQQRGRDRVVPTWAPCDRRRVRHALTDSVVGPALTQRILAAYPVDQYEQPARGADRGDDRSAFHVHRAEDRARPRSQGQTEPVYRYYFTHTMASGPLARWARSTAPSSSSCSATCRRRRTTHRRRDRARPTR